MAMPTHILRTDWYGLYRIQHGELLWRKINPEDIHRLGRLAGIN
jgi:hypothetical protein